MLSFIVFFALAVGIFKLLVRKTPLSDYEKWNRRMKRRSSFSDDGFASGHDHHSSSCVDIDNDNDIGLSNNDSWSNW